jgi:antitoxin HigA-1
MSMYNPSHPGQIIRQRLIEDEGGHKIDSVAVVAER